LRLWWRSDVGLESSANRVTRWADSSARDHPGLPNPAGPILLTPPAPGRPAVEVSSADSLASAPIDFSTALHRPGATLIAVVHPPLPGPAGVFQPFLSVAGTPLGAIDGRLAARPDPAAPVLAAPTALAPGPHLISLALAHPPAATRLFVDGQLVAEGPSPQPAPAAPVQLGGFASAWPAAVGEVAAFAGVLSRAQRVVWERMLAGKWQQAGPLAGDTDGDGLPDWWEWEAATDPAFPDAQGDADLDGIANLSALHQRRGGFVWIDADRDGMHDHWESAAGLDPELDDAGLDLDGDALANALEHALGTHPAVAPNPVDAWTIALAGDPPAINVTVAFRRNHRSWRHRPILEQSNDLAHASWIPLPLADTLTPPADGVSPVSATAPVHLHPASHFRVRLLDE
jgi:hypothetical protein